MTARKTIEDNLKSALAKLGVLSNISIFHRILTTLVKNARKDG